MPILNSQADCQVAPADTQTKTWQRVCLCERTNKTTDKQADEKEHRSDNITYTQAGVSCFVGQEIAKIKVYVSQEIYSLTENTQFRTSQQSVSGGTVLNKSNLQFKDCFFYANSNDLK